MAVDVGAGTVTAEAVKLAAKIGSATTDAAVFVGALGEELPLLQPVLKTLRNIRTQVDMVKTNKEDLTALHERCAFVTASFIVKCKESSTSEMETVPLEDCVQAVEKLVGLCRRRRRVFRVLRASWIKEEMSGLNSRIDRLTSDMGLAGIATLERKSDDMKAMLVRDVELNLLLRNASLLFM